MPAHFLLRTRDATLLCVVSIGAFPAPGISVARTLGLEALIAHGRCSAAAARGSEVSLCRFLQDQLVQRQVQDCPRHPLVLLLNILHPPRLIGLQAAIFLAPAIIGRLAHRDPPARFGRPGSLCHYISTSRGLPMISSGLCFLPGIHVPSVGQGADQRSTAASSRRKRQSRNGFSLAQAQIPCSHRTARPSAGQCLFR